MRRNPFDGKSIKTRFIWKLYSKYMSRSWFTLTEVMEEYKSDHDKNQSSELKNISSKAKKASLKMSSEVGNSALKKANMDIKRLIIARAGEDSIEERGNNKHKEFRYCGDSDDPLSDYKSASAVNNIRTYVRFCLDSAGFFPISWLSHFFEGTLDLLNIEELRNNGALSIVSSADRQLTNIELLPRLYEAIRDKEVLPIKYRPKAMAEVLWIVHPHILKEYNGRWFLFGYVDDGKYKRHGRNLALDRIVKIEEGGDDESIKDIKYVKAPQNFYQNFFEDIIGVSKNNEGKPAEDIRIRIRNYRMFNLITTKPFHSSQKTVTDYGAHEDGVKYGEITLHVELNNEFIGRILQMGAGLEVVSPEWIRNEVKQRIFNMAEIYK